MIIRAFSAALLIAVSAPAQAEQPPVHTLTNSFFAKRTDTAINGYDSVAYFTENNPVKGQDAWTYEWKGAKWKFSSEKNLALFKKDPERDAPQYGGCCAYGVAKDSLVKIDPQQFTVLGGKLYLNYNAGIQKDGLKDRDGFITQANEKFAQLLKK